MKAVNARCAGVYMKHAQCLVELHLQYMRMTADEQLGRMHQDASLYGRIVFAGIAADVFHQHLGAVYRKTEHLRIEPAQILPVYVAVHRTERTESRQLLCHFQRTDVTCMPYNLARLEVLQILLIPIPVRIRQ